MVFSINDHAQQLQATRGLAALSVTVGHCFTTMVAGRIEDPGFRLAGDNAVLAGGQLLFQPNTAVIFFYVLSGLVLGESLRRQPDLRSFAIRRLWRLLPVMWASIAVALVVLSIVPARPLTGATAWFNAFFGRTIPLDAIASDAVGLSWHVNSVLWSVQIELLMIVLLPPLLAVTDRSSRLVNGVLWVVLAAAALLLWGKLPDWANAVLYLHCFQAGLFLPRLAAAGASRAILRNPVVTALTIPALIGIDLLYDTGRLSMPYKFVADALISTQILGYVLTRPTGRLVGWLRARPLVRLGDISFSFYVYSLSLQLLLGGWLLHALPGTPGGHLATALTLAITVGTVSGAIAMATLSHRWIERPSIALGRAWSATAFEKRMLAR